MKMTEIKALADKDLREKLENAVAALRPDEAQPPDYSA